MRTLAKLRFDFEEGDTNTKIFNIINTSEYCGDMCSTIIVECDDASNLVDYGFDEYETDQIESLKVGEVYESADYGNECLVIRMK
jgi:hypothetical protein